MFVKSSRFKQVCQLLLSLIVASFFGRPQVVENPIGNICFSEQIFHRKQSLGTPDDWGRKAKNMNKADKIWQETHAINL